MYFILATLAATVAAKQWPNSLLRRDTPTFSCTEATNATQIRLAYYGPNGMAVSWNTNQKLSNPTVHYGSDADNLDKHADSQISKTYPTSSTYNNHVVIEGLKPDTVYYYQPQCGNVVQSFKTARAPGDDKPFNFAMIGDMGTFGPDGLSTTFVEPTSLPLRLPSDFL
jgi:hypothetical protein